MSWVDGWGALARDDTEPLIQGGVGEIGTTLRVDVKKVVAVHARPFDPFVSDEIDVFMSTVPYSSFPTDTPASTRFLDVLRRGYDFEATLFAAGEIGARSLPSLGAGLIDNSDDEQDVFQTYEWGGRSWRVFVGEQNQQFASFTEVWPGRSGRDVELGRDVIEVPLEDVARRFDQPVQQTTFEPGFEPYVEFDGVDDFIDFGDVLDRGTGNFVWGCAFRTTALQDSALYNKGAGTGTGAGAGYVIGILPTGEVVAKIADGTDIARAVAAVTYNDGLRHTLVARVDRSTETLFLEFDGVQVATADTTLVGSVDNASTLKAGAFSATTQRLNGEIERVASQSVASSTNVQGFLDERFPEDFDTSVFGAFAHAVPMNENVGTTVGDLGAGGFDGTIQGGVTAKWSGLQNGRRELDGERIPLAYGNLTGELVPLAGEPDVRRMRVEPVLLDEIKQVYKWHNGSSEQIRQAEDGGLELTPETIVGDFWTNDDGPTAGSFWVDLTDSLIRLGAAPERKLTVSVLGDNTPAFEDEPHRILRRIAGTRVGIPEPAGFEDAAFTALDGLPRVGIYIRDERIDETFDWLMQSVQGWWAIGRTGLITVDQLKVPTSSEATITDDNVVAASRRRSAVPAVHWRDRVQYGRNWAPQAQGELLAALSSARRDVFVRETLVVQDANDAFRPTAAGTPFLRSADVTLDSLLSSQIAAENILGLTRNLFGARREVWEIRMPIGILQFWLGDVVEFGPDVTRFNLAGRKFLVIGIRETVTAGVTLTLWG